MNYKIIYTDSYINKAKRFVKNHPELITQYEKILKILENDPHHPSLRLHRLKGKLKDLHSISISFL